MPPGATSSAAIAAWLKDLQDSGQEDRFCAFLLEGLRQAGVRLAQYPASTTSELVAMMLTCLYFRYKGDMAQVVAELVRDMTPEDMVEFEQKKKEWLGMVRY